MTRILCLRVENVPSASDCLDVLQSLAARCKQFTPLVGIDPDVFPQSVLLDITNVTHLFGGEAALVRRILDELHDSSRQLRAAVAATPGAAWALARYGEKREEGEKGRGTREAGRGERENTFVSPSPFLPLSLSSAPLEALRLPEPTVALLHSLGVWRIEQLQALPRRELSSRFGPELLDCLDRVTGKLPEPLPTWEPPRQFEVHWSAEFPTARREMIESALERLARRLAAMLTRAGRGALRLECLLKCAAGEPRQVGHHVGHHVPMVVVVVVGLFRPSAWANHLVGLLQVRLESLQLPGPVDSIRLAAASTAPLELRQKELFSEGRGHHVPMVVVNEEPHHLAGLIDRLSNRLGHACVMRVRLIPDAQPELACHYTPLVQATAGMETKHPKGRSGKRHPEGTRSPFPPRPLRLLLQPVLLPGGGHHVGHHVPMVGGLFSFAGRQERIVRRVGPERIETGWWRGRTVARDYYRIETASGRCYWVFRSLRDAQSGGRWFLHGVFD